MAVATRRIDHLNLVEITKAVDGFSRGETVTVPSSGSLEIDMLATAFTRVMDEARRKAAALNEEVEERRRIDEVLNNTITNMVDPVLVSGGTKTIRHRCRRPDPRRQPIVRSILPRWRDAVPDQR